MYKLISQYISSLKCELAKHKRVRLPLAGVEKGPCDCVE